MTPDELKSANIRRFERLLGEATDPGKRQAIERMLAEERAKPLSAYPQPAPPPQPRRDDRA